MKVSFTEQNQILLITKMKQVISKLPLNCGNGSIVVTDSEHITYKTIDGRAGA